MYIIYVHSKGLSSITGNVKFSAGCVREFHLVCREYWRFSKAYSGSPGANLALRWRLNGMQNTILAVLQALVDKFFMVLCAE